MPRLFVFLICTLCYALTAPVPVHAGSQHLFKIASLAPEGSVWIDSFREFAEEVTDKTDGAVTFRIYPGGIMGDDRAMYRKIRVGQLQGGGFTMTGISDIVSDFSVMAIPFLFRSYDEVDTVRAVMEPLFKKRFDEKGLSLVAMTEVGFIYTLSNKPRATIDDLQQAKTWAPANDPITSAFLVNLNISPIPLTIPDVLSSLQTGLIDTAFNSLYGAIVLQWFTKAPYITDQPYGYAYGGFVLSRKAYARLSVDQQRIVDEAATRHFSALILKTRQSNEESRDVLIQQGVTFVPTTAETVATLEERRDRAIDTLIGTAFSASAYQTLKATLVDYRAASKHVPN